MEVQGLNNKAKMKNKCKFFFKGKYIYRHNFHVYKPILMF